MIVPPPGRQHAGQHGADGIVGADQVDLDVARPGRGVAVRDAAIGSITPALLTRTSTLPKRPSVSLTSAATAA